MAGDNPPGAVTPDSGWSWIVCIGNMGACFSMIGICRCLGVFYPAIMVEFDVDYTQVSLISGLFTGTMAIGSLFVLLVKWFGYRKVGLVTSFLFSMTILTASQSNSIFMLTLCCGALAGLLSGTAVNVVLLTIPIYFAKHRSKAAALAASAMSIGALVGAPAISRLIGDFGWRGAMLIVSAVSLHAFVGISLYRPAINKDAKIAIRNTRLDDIADTSPPPATSLFRFKTICDYTLFSRPIYILCYLASMTFWSAMVGCMFLIIPHGMETIGLDRSDASILLTAQSGGDIVGQFLGGVIGDIKGIDRVMFLGTTTALSALMLFVVTLCKGFPLLCIAVFSLGLACAPYAGLYIVLYSEVFTSDKLTSAVSYDGFMAAALTLPATYSLGIIIDVTGDVSVAYYVCGGSMSICSICIFGIYLLKRNKLNHERKCTV